MFRWQPPAGGSAVERYRLLRGPPPAAGPWAEALDLAAESDGEGRLRARVEGFADDRVWAVAVIALGPGGQSQPSNVLAIPARVTGIPCPEPPRPRPPGPPTDLEIIEGLLVRARGDVDQLEELRRRAAEGPR